VGLKEAWGGKAKGKKGISFDRTKGMNRKNVQQEGAAHITLIAGKRRGRVYALLIRKVNPREERGLFWEKSKSDGGGVTTVGEKEESSYPLSKNASSS